MYSATKFCGQTARKSISLSRRYLRHNKDNCGGHSRVWLNPDVTRQLVGGSDGFLLYQLRVGSGRPEFGTHSTWGQYSIFSFHSSTSDHAAEESSSKVEESVKVIKADLQEKEKAPTLVVVPKRSLWKRIEDEILHYYHGFRLLFIDTKICAGLVYRVLNGHNLTRREHRQLVRTTSDLFRLAPFSVFIIVPFMELLLPVFLKFFPGMLPSTFQTKNDRENKMKAQLKVKLEMAKFLQKTLDDMSLESKGHSSENAKEFALFFSKIRTLGTEVSNADIIKFSKLFEDEITLDSLSRQQLTALCRVLELPPLGNNTLLRFQLRMRLRSLTADDKSIELEGLNSLTVGELQMACKARGMRAVGVPKDRLRRQLEQWLQLSLHEKVPPSLLLLSRALYLPEDLPTTAQLQATISALPETAATLAKAAIGEREGKVENKTRIELIQEEERKIIEERTESAILDASKKPKIPIKEEHIIEVPAAVPDLHTEQVTVTITKQPVEKEAEVVPPKLVEQPLPAHPEPAPLATEMFRAELRGEEPTTVAETVDWILSRQVPHPVAHLHKGGLLTPEDLANIGIVLAKLASEKEHIMEEIKDLKVELADYKEDVHDLDVLKQTKTHQIEVKESKAAQRLYKRVNKMVTKLDSVVSELEQEETRKKSS